MFSRRGGSGQLSNFKLESVITEEPFRRVYIPFEYERVDEDDFGSIVSNGVSLFVFKDAHGFLTPQNFHNGRLALKDANLITREYFTFGTMLDVKNAVEDIVLEGDKLVATVNDKFFNRKLKVSMFAPEWLVEKYS
ncbi:hypothetical protein COF68_05805 [Bacillus toyonensis]|uniref:hypothetical protein n=1 Tax=Bacillus toyonensis TaxID=155322 RepID=UPI000BFCBB8E|nr:hypothetical protein [Bacillus toyonensis]PHE64355.1 hypothetical protein COF68_05805 [Bacillus toyonensis]